MEANELDPVNFVRYNAYKGQEEQLRKEAAAMLRAACMYEQKAEAILKPVIQ